MSLSPSTFPIPDADDTAVALLLLHEAGERVDAAVLERFVLPEGHFASFPHERHPSVGVNLHVLHALLRVPGYADQERVVERLVDFILAQQVDNLYWLDKWHISPYYATAHALRVFAELPARLTQRVNPAVERAHEWLRETQSASGGWGFYGLPTVEETAYGVLAMTRRTPANMLARASGRRYVREHQHAALPPLWIDKCLYTPTLVVRAAIQASLEHSWQRGHLRAGTASVRSS